MTAWAAIVRLLGGWRATVFAVLAVAAMVTAAGFWLAHSHARNRADTAERRAEALQGELRAAREAAKRDVVSDVATSAARESGEQRQAKSAERVERIEAIEREARPVVPAVCPSPDSRLSGQIAEGDAELRAAEDRLRNL